MGEEGARCAIGRTRIPRTGRTLFFLLFAGSGLAGEATAHGFGQRYDLPLPLSIWLAGAGASILISFLGVAVFLRAGRTPNAPLAHNLLTSRIGRTLSSAPVVLGMRSLFAGLWFLAIAAGLLGAQDPYRNIAPTLVWVLGWVGTSFASILFGDLWGAFHPLGSAFRALEALTQRALGSTHRFGLGWKLPDSVGVWPAVFMFVVFAWLELAWSQSDVPQSLGCALAIYSGISFLGMFAFGREEWLRRAEFFGVAFGVLARFSPFELRATSAAGTRAWNLRLPGVGLLEELPRSLSELVFVLLMLATVSFDGFLETRQWLDIADGLSIAPPMQPVLEAFRSVGFNDNEALVSIGFLAFPMLFILTSLAVARLTRSAALRLGRAEPLEVASTQHIAKSLVSTLVPIAIAYHLAHYLSMFAISGQYVIPLASDPFGYGWDLFGSASYKVDIGIIGVRFVWNFAAVTIVTGHIISVVLAHLLALRNFPTRRAALGSQLPTLCLMIAYTMLSLWILAQPIVA